jgi:hypothetical protein
MRNRIITTDSYVGVVSKILLKKIQYHNHSVIHRNDNKIFNSAHLTESCDTVCAIFIKHICILKLVVLIG